MHSIIAKETVDWYYMSIDLLKRVQTGIMEVQMEFECKMHTTILFSHLSVTSNLSDTIHT